MVASPELRLKIGNHILVHLEALFISSRLTVFVNGKFCKDPKLATPNDFFFSGLRVPGNTSNKLGSMVTPANVAQIPGLFGSKPAISAYVLTKGFQVDKNVVEYLQSQFWTDNHTY
ncbi:putative germin-like protein subfamily 1 member 2 [Vitis vinifera]|uniref:Putative germin-like protein subfamily 1 member 2 n=1 Tax=Vitis vinifera TaxID=29760 RepID=A0A438IN82_VITVI|nr:putative germin-like protein subfamily 1 member 2 [Vitis vinifera]RVW98166.1 putative germin-like protein subfamily 1 member 2 [Vitis vinifera]